MSEQHSDSMEELRALLDEFVLYTDNTPSSNEPTELSVFLEGCQFPDVIERLHGELSEFMKTYAQQVAREALRNELKTVSFRVKDALSAPAGPRVIVRTYLVDEYIEKRLAELDKESK